LREKLKADVKSIKAITIGPSKAADTLRTALAMGADSAIHVELPESSPSPEPLAVAKTLRAIIEKHNASVKEVGDKFDLVILGKQAIDDDFGVTGQMLAGLLGWSQATFASKVVLDIGKNEAVVTREIDGGGEEIRCRLPLVVTTDLRYVQNLFVAYGVIYLDGVLTEVNVALNRLNGKPKLLFTSFYQFGFFFLQNRTPLCVFTQYYEGQKETHRKTLTSRSWPRLYSSARNRQSRRATKTCGRS